MIYIKLLFIILVSIRAEIHIWEPSSLRQIYKNEQLDYSIANFGSVPYGHSVYGTVFAASPLDACHDLKPLNWEKNTGTLIIYAQRGNCHFAQKVLNAQKAGAGLVIIGDTNDEDVHKILPVERTTQLMNQIRIPSILIMKKDAENFYNVLSGDQGTLSMAIHFPLTKANDVASIKMILQVDDYRSYESVLALAQYKQPFENSMKLQIHYKVFKNIKNMFDPKNCIKNDDVYCIFTENKNSQNLLLETLKQICLFNLSWNDYVNYFKNVEKDCFDSLQQPLDEFTQCTNKTYEKSVDKYSREQIKNCLDPSSDEAKKFLNENNDNIKYYLINYSPIVFINGYMYKGNYKDSSHLMEAFCNSFEEVPPQCQNLRAFQQYYDFSSYGVLKFILLSVLSTLFATAVIVSIFYFFYRKKIKSSFKVELNDKINEALAKYYNDGSKEFDYSGVAKNNQFLQFYFCQLIMSFSNYIMDKGVKSHDISEDETSTSLDRIQLVTEELLYYKLLRNHKTLMFFLIVFHGLLLLTVILHGLNQAKVGEENLFCQYSIDLRNIVYIIFNLVLFGFSFKALTKNKALLSNIQYYEKTIVLFSFGMFGSCIIFLYKFVPDIACRNNTLNYQSTFLFAAHILLENLLLYYYVTWFKNKLRGFGALINQLQCLKNFKEILNKLSSQSYASNDRLNYKSFSSINSQINYLDRNISYLNPEEKNQFQKIRNKREKMGLTMGIIWGSLFIATNLTGHLFVKKRQIGLVQRIFGFVVGGFGAASYTMYNNHIQSNETNMLFLQTIQRKVEREGHF